MRCHLGTEDVQLILVSLGCQVLHKDDTSMLAVNAFVINVLFSFLDLSADEDGIAGSSVVASAFLIFY